MLTLTKLAQRVLLLSPAVLGVGTSVLRVRGPILLVGTAVLGVGRTAVSVVPAVLCVRRLLIAD